MTLATWRRFNGVLVILMLLLWLLAWHEDWINSIRFVSHMSMLALVLAALAAWRADS